jgi:hypothetical protein
MKADMLLPAICYGFAFISGFLLFISPFTSRGRVAQHWVRLALWLVSPIALAWSALGFVLLFGKSDLSEHTYFLVRHFKTLCAGMALGILGLLFASGELIRAFSKPKAPGGQ